MKNAGCLMLIGFQFGAMTMIGLSVLAGKLDILIPMNSKALLATAWAISLICVCVELTRARLNEAGEKQ